MFLPSLPLLLASRAQGLYLGEDKAVFQPAREKRKEGEEGGEGEEEREGEGSQR